MPTVKIEQEGRVLVATLENPPHALMNQEMVGELGQLAERAERDDGVGAIVLTGAHPERFLAHFDVSALLEGAESSPQLPLRAAKASVRTVRGASRAPGSERLIARTPAAGMLDLFAFHDTLLRMSRSGAVFIAAINGSTMGGGCELSLACDLRYMAGGGVIGQPEILLGFPPGGGGTQRLARLIGGARALELVLEGAPVSAERAAEIGLVNRVVEGERLLEEATETARRLARRPKAAVGGAKRAVLEGGSLPLAEGLRLENAEFFTTLTTEHSKRLMRAYVERLERTGEVPAYDPEGQRALIDGTFVDLYGED